jgi:hypothetical protein
MKSLWKKLLIAYIVLQIWDLLSTYIGGPIHETNLPLKDLWIRYGFWVLVVGKLLLVGYIGGLAILFQQLKLKIPNLIYLGIQTAIYTYIAINNALFLMLAAIRELSDELDALKKG